MICGHNSHMNRNSSVTEQTHRGQNEGLRKGKDWNPPGVYFTSTWADALHRCPVESTN